MKRLLLVLFAMFALTAVAMAAGPTYGVISIACTATPSVAVSTGSAAADYNDVTATFTVTGMATGSTCNLSPFYIWNTSPAAASAVETFSLETPGATTVGAGTQWTYRTATYVAPGSVGVDAVEVIGAFAANNSSITWNNNFGLINYNSGVPVMWTTGGNFNGGGTGGAYGSSKLGNPTAGTPSNVLLWIQINTPSSVSSTNAHFIQVNVTTAMAG